MYISATAAFGICYFSNNIGVRFTNVPISNNFNFNVDNVAQVYCDSIISDTSNWVKISGSFVADSVYRYLIIGNFFEDAHTNLIGGCSETGASAYYYVDEISVSTDSIVAIEDNVLDANTIQIYPNPTNNIIYLNKKRNIDYIITDALGKIMQNANNYSANQINVEGLPNGIYFLLVNQKTSQRISIIH